ncbi:tyrosine-type recombinase/integrase [Nonomuraea sp. NPDC004702]
MKPKGQSKRIAVIPPPLIPLHKLHQKANRPRRKQRGSGGRTMTSSGATRTDPIGAGQDWDGWKELLRLAEVEKDARVRDARHTAATLLIKQGVDISVVQEILGHSQLTTTEPFTHITATLSTEAAARMAGHFGDNRNSKCNRAGFQIVEIGESAQVVEVGRPGLEPGTYGLKSPAIRVEWCRDFRPGAGVRDTAGLPTVSHQDRETVLFTYRRPASSRTGIDSIRIGRTPNRSAHRPADSRAHVVRSPAKTGQLRPPSSLRRMRSI